MEKRVLVNEIMWEYNVSRSRAEKIIAQYEKHNNYDHLCELVKNKQAIAVVISSHV